MRILVTGATGQLGLDVVKELKVRGHIPIATGTKAEYGDKVKANGDLAGLSGISDVLSDVEYVQLDISDETRVMQVMERTKPDVVINCAAWTAVDAAEDEANKEKVRGINALGPQYLAEACKKLDSTMIQVSTDYVFDGKGSNEWKPDCREYRPVNYYGEQKLQGELAVAATLDKYYIVRIAWAFGLNGSNFVRTMLRLGKNHDELKVVSDQVGTPTYTRDLARLLADMAECDEPAKYGYYHATNEGGFISWYDFACAVFEMAARLGHSEYARKELKIIPVTTEEYGLSRAARPLNSRLDKSKLKEAGFTPLPDWQDALERYLREILNDPERGE